MVPAPETPERPDSADPERAAIQIEQAQRPAGAKRATMPAKEFVSERDALEDAWSGGGDRDEGW